MTRMSISAASLAFALSLGVSALAQEPPPAPVVLQPLPAPGTVTPAAQPAPQPQPAQPPPGQPNVIIVQPTPAQPAPVVQPPPAQPPAVYVYELPPPPSYNYVPPPPPVAKPMKQAGVHTHDGFYLRMGLGVGGVAVSSTRQSRDSSDSLSTGGAAIEFGMGGTLGDGFVLGGRLIGVGGDSLRLESAEQSTDVGGSLFYSTVQLFADWYVDPEWGLHLEAALGPAGLTYDPTPSSRSGDTFEGDEVNFDGFGGSLGVGWEGWIGEQWSLGGLLRVNWATFDGVFDASAPDEPLRASGVTDEETGRIIAVAPMLMLTGTFH
jgi:hypothetical protein